ncbi:MAG: hypothetical protein K6E50_10775 [Lachnospiraceae bacterium]|nr:hypothetical protein [Lachnospiraceae bacterium]
MNAFYSLWTAPAAGGRAFVMQDYDLACLLLSVAAWERHNGKAKLYADAPAEDFFVRRGLDEVFGRGVERFSVPEGIDPVVFWAAGKLCALAREEEPSVMIDTDLIVWRGITKELRETKLAVIHREELNPEIYPDPGIFRMKADYHYPAGWDFRTRPANTALLYIRDNDFRQAYVKEALRFMENCLEKEDRLRPMVFAEQRILPMVAQERGLSLHAFCARMEELREQDRFTHLWGHKNVLKFNMDERRIFVRRCMDRMKREFPEMHERAVKVPELELYATGTDR